MEGKGEPAVGQAAGQRLQQAAIRIDSGPMRGFRVSCDAQQTFEQQGRGGLNRLRFHASAIESARAMPEDWAGDCRPAVTGVASSNP
jgi:hypothetical protein